MDGAGVPHEVRAGERVPCEELVRKHVSLQPVARGAGGNEVARNVRAAARQRIDVVERRFSRVERMAAVHAAPAAVAHRGALERALGVTRNP